MRSKICKDCNKIKSVKRFSISTVRYKDKIFTYCRNVCNICRGRKDFSKYKDTYTRVWREKNIEKFRIHGQVYRALKKGLLSKFPCQKCGIQKNIHAHHSDYSKPLEILWLCPIHHKEIHKNLSVDNKNPVGLSGNPI